MGRSNLRCTVLRIFLKETLNYKLKYFRTCRLKVTGLLVLFRPLYRAFFKGWNRQCVIFLYIISQFQDISVLYVLPFKSYRKIISCTYLPTWLYTFNFWKVIESWIVYSYFLLRQVTWCITLFLLENLSVQETIAAKKMLCSFEFLLKRP